MNFVQITPGAGAMYCGNCLRDNALVGALSGMGHRALMVPVYLPLTLDEPDQSAGIPVFFAGTNVFLDQRYAWYRSAPGWLHRFLGARPLLGAVSRWAGKTRPSGLGELTLSMLRGEAGNQARELEELVAWLGSQCRPDVLCLSNALLIGMARRLKTSLGCRVACMLQGEDTFLDALAEPHRTRCWETVAERAAELETLVAPSRYFADLMQSRLRLPPGRIRIVHNGINTRGFDPGPRPPRPAGAPRVFGYFARMCPEKGLDLVVEAYELIRQRARAPDLRLRVGGSCGPADIPFVDRLRARLSRAGLLDKVEFRPNLDRAAKIQFLESLDVYSVPARYGEAFGLYLLEAWAAGVPAVQPAAAAFPELVQASGGGLLCRPESATDLADKVETLLLDPELASRAGASAKRAVAEGFSAKAMAEQMLAACGV